MGRSRMTRAWGLVVTALLIETTALELARRALMDSQRPAPGMGAGIGFGIAAVFLVRLLTVAAAASCGLLVAGAVVGSRASGPHRGLSRAARFPAIVAALAGGIFLAEGMAMVPFLLRLRASRGAIALEATQERDFVDRHWTLREAEGPIREAFLAGDGSRCGTSAGDDVVFWSTVSGEEDSRRRLAYDKARHLQLTDVAVSRDGRFVAAIGGSGQRAVLGWGPESTSELPWHADGSLRFVVPELVGNSRRAWLHRRLYMFGSEGNREEESLALVDPFGASTAGVPGVLRNHDLDHGVLIAAAVDRASQWLAVAVRNPPGSGSVQIFDAVDGGLVEEASLPTLPSHAAPIAIASSGRLIAYDDGERSRVVALAEDGKNPDTVFQLQSPGVLAAAAFDGDDRRVAFLYRENLPLDFGRSEWREDPLPSSVHVVDLATSDRRSASITGNRHQARGPGLFTPDLSLVVVPGWQTLFRYDVASGRELQRASRQPVRP